MIVHWRTGTFFKKLFRGFTPLPTAFPRDVFAGACPPFSCNDERGGSARSAPQRQPAHGLDSVIYDGISAKSCLVGHSAHRFTAGLPSSRVSFGNMVSYPRSPGSTGHPASAANVGACVGSRDLGQNWNSPRTYMPSRLRR